MDLLEQAQYFEKELTNLINSVKLSGVTIFYILQNYSMKINEQLMQAQLQNLNSTENMQSNLIEEAEEAGQE